jgi:hypothetical protein
MADFFDKLRQGLNKGVTTASVRSKEMLDASRLKSKIAEYERQKKEALTELGTTVCTMLDGGDLDEGALGVARKAIASIEDQIAEKQQELARVHAEAEQALAEPPQAAPEPPLAAPEPPQAAPEGGPVSSTCVCGASLATGARFCGSCGRSTDAPQETKPN